MDSCLMCLKSGKLHVIVIKFIKVYLKDNVLFITDYELII